MGIRVILPRAYDLVVGDTFQLFYTGVVEAPNPYIHDIYCVCDAGASFPRYFEYTPDAPGFHTLTVQVCDAAKTMLGEGTVKLVVHDAPRAPEKPVHILCFGDSLTAGGQWAAEAARRLTGQFGRPAGHSLGNIRFIGGKTYRGIGYEGTGGWAWDTYFSPGTETAANPFWFNGAVDFRAYCEKQEIDGIDCVYILLGYNGIASMDRPEAEDHAELCEKAAKMLDTIHRDCPGAQVRLFGLAQPSMRGGTGTSYQAAEPHCDRYGWVRFIMGLNLAYEKLAERPEYRDFVRFINLSGQFDCENAYPAIEKPVNVRSSRTERFETNGVHPTEEGYMMIADAAYRSLVRDLGSL